MRIILGRRVGLATLFFATITLPTGCGSSKPPDGTHINVTIPPEIARKQNDAYKNYAKTAAKKGQPPK